MDLTNITHYIDGPDGQYNPETTGKQSSWLNRKRKPMPPIAKPWPVCVSRFGELKRCCLVRCSSAALESNREGNCTKTVGFGLPLKFAGSENLGEGNAHPVEDSSDTGLEIPDK